MADFERKRQEAAYKVFARFALEDQRKYYKESVRLNRTAATQVNRIRAIFALLTGLASALAGLIVLLTPADCQRAQLLSALSQTGTQVEVEATADPQLSPANVPLPEQTMTPFGYAPFGCGVTNLAIPFLLVIAVIAPALGGAFGTLADLFQWDRLVSIYEVALENLEVADAKSPLPEMDEIQYRASTKAYAEGTLSVMRDETAQWGQIIRTPESLEKFIKQEMATANNTSQTLPENVRAFISGEMQNLKAATEATNQRLDELRGFFAQDAGTTPPAEPPEGENPPTEEK